MKNLKSIYKVFLQWLKTLFCQMNPLSKLAYLGHDENAFIYIYGERHQAERQALGKYYQTGLFSGDTGGKSGNNMIPRKPSK